eukprot:GHVQ01020667.1.p1 GENE.GHVQ01020667.1~~GHVQ01020667.1.p1  ORF type:complete len:128 (+),score=18.06 GHVQ01020667.1:24-386(+)
MAMENPTVTIAIQPQAVSNAMEQPHNSYGPVDATVAVGNDPDNNTEGIAAPSDGPAARAAVQAVTHPDSLGNRNTRDALQHVDTSVRSVNLRETSDGSSLLTCKQAGRWGWDVSMGRERQ